MKKEMNKQDGVWRAGTRTTIMGGEDTVFAVLMYGDVLVKELKIVWAVDKSAVVSAYKTTADALNLIKLTPSTIDQVATKMAELFPPTEARQEEIKYDEVN